MRATYTWDPVGDLVVCSHQDYGQVSLYQNATEEAGWSLYFETRHLQMLRSLVAELEDIKCEDERKALVEKVKGEA